MIFGFLKFRNICLTLKNVVGNEFGSPNLEELNKMR